MKKVLVVFVGLMIIGRFVFNAWGQTEPVVLYFPFMAQGEAVVIHECQKHTWADGGMEAIVLDQINQANAHQQTHAPELTQSARTHSLDMAQNKFTGHTGSDGSTAQERMAEACFAAARGTEIIGWGFGGDVAKMMGWWLNSDVHRWVIMSDSYDHIGAGYVHDADSEWAHYWTVNFAQKGNAKAITPEFSERCVVGLETAIGGVSIERGCP